MYLYFISFFCSRKAIYTKNAENNPIIGAVIPPMASPISFGFKLSKNPIFLPINTWKNNYNYNKTQKYPNDIIRNKIYYSVV
jgi:hypothetical protein